jgi:hypothetical protein
VGDVFYLDVLYAFLDGSNLARYTATASKLARPIRRATATKYMDYPDEGIRIHDFGRFKIDVRLSDITS